MYKFTVYTPPSINNDYPNVFVYLSSSKHKQNVIISHEFRHNYIMRFNDPHPRIVITLVRLYTLTCDLSQNRQGRDNTCSNIHKSCFGYRLRRVPRSSKEQWTAATSGRIRPLPAQQWPTWKAKGGKQRLMDSGEIAGRVARRGPHDAFSF